MVEHQLAKQPHSDFVAAPSEFGSSAVMIASSPGMLLAAAAVIALSQMSQDCIFAFIVQVGATGAAE